MAVVAAGVHYTGGLALQMRWKEISRALFKNRKRIHVRPQQNSGAFAVTYLPHHARGRDVFVFDSHFIELSFDNSRGAELLPHQLGRAVQLSSYRYDVVGFGESGGGDIAQTKRLMR